MSYSLKHTDHDGGASGNAHVCDVLGADGGVIFRLFGNVPQGESHPAQRPGAEAMPLAALALLLAAALRLALAGELCPPARPAQALAVRTL